MGQAVNPNMLMQFRSVLASKGVGEEELRQNLKQKGLNVDSMTEADALKNRNVIEQSIGELEKKNKAKTDTQTVNKPAMAFPATKISTTTLTPEMQTQDISPQ